jgi:formamidopyrimidine-DNA glycosylase
MVEGHSVHRVAHAHRRRLCGRRFVATSPNGRFAAGAAAISGGLFFSIEAIGKNLFAWFRAPADGAEVCVHVHFGMSGAWATFDAAEEEVPEPTPTTRLRLEEIVDGGSGGPGLVTHLSAMTVQHGIGRELFESKRRALGEDPLRPDAQPLRLWEKVAKTKKGIGALLMDQSYFAGPGNIYRAEILFKAGIHPNVAGRDLTRDQFDAVWAHSVALLRRGYETGSILTVDAAEAKTWAHPSSRRRYIYNQQSCPRCGDTVMSWDINNRTCYACQTCQPPPRQQQETPDTQAGGGASESVATATVDGAATAVSKGKGASVSKKRKKKDKGANSAGDGAKDSSEPRPAKLFRSHCAPESLAMRLAQGAEKLSVKELREQLTARGLAHDGLRKPALVAMLSTAMEPIAAGAAAAEKAAAGEHMAVEHVAELHPSQTRAARAAAAAVAGATGEQQPPPPPYQKYKRRQRRKGDPMRAGPVSALEQRERKR